MDRLSFAIREVVNPRHIYEVLRHQRCDVIEGKMPPEKRTEFQNKCSGAELIMSKAHSTTRFRAIKPKFRILGTPILSHCLFL